MTMASPLETELGVFEIHRWEWAQSHPGKFVVIREDNVVKFFDEYEEAFRAGIQQFGADRDFLIKQVWKTEPVATKTFSNTKGKGFPVEMVKLEGLIACSSTARLSP